MNACNLLLVISLFSISLLSAIFAATHYRLADRIAVGVFSVVTQSDELSERSTLFTPFSVPDLVISFGVVVAIAGTLYLLVSVSARHIKQRKDAQYEKKKIEDKSRPPWTPER